jgi:two-component system, NtrC family, sensor kinase
MTEGAEPIRSAPRGFSLRAKVMGSYLGVLVIFGSVLGFALVQMGRTRAELSGIASGYTSISREIDELTGLPLGYAMGREEVNWARYQPNLDLLYLDLMQLHVARARVHGEAMQGQLEDPVEAAALREVLAQLELAEHLLQMYRRDQEVLDGCLRHGDEACARAVAAGLTGLRSQITEVLGILKTKIELRIQNALVVADETQFQANRRLLYLSVTAIVLAGLMLLLVHLSLRPVDRLIRGVQRIGEGHYEERIEVETRDEVGQLADEFNRMAASLGQRERRLLQMERLATVGRMSAQVAHEIRNPLNALSLNAELLGDDIDQLEQPARDEAWETLRQLQAEIDRLAAVTEGYLSLARPPDPERVPGDLGELVEKVRDFLADELAGAGVIVETRIQPDLPLVPMDADQMRQVLLNLLRNAMEAQPDGGAVEIAVTDGDGGVVLQVTDHGQGVDPGIRDQVFDALVSGKERGTGLGLAIVRQIVAGHGGSIEFRSQPGKGTTFEIVLPLEGG